MSTLASRLEWHLVEADPSQKFRVRGYLDFDDKISTDRVFFDGGRSSRFFSLPKLLKYANDNPREVILISYWSDFRLQDILDDAKLRIQGGEVQVNGSVESRRGRKLQSGDVVELAGHRFTIESTEPGDGTATP